MFNSKSLALGFLGLVFASNGLAEEPKCVSWYPSNPTYHVKNVTYDLRTKSFGGMARIALGFVEDASHNYFHYFNPADPVQISRAHGIYSSLLAALASEQVVSIYLQDAAQSSAVSGGTNCYDPYSTGMLDFISVQVGPN